MSNKSSQIISNQLTSAIMAGGKSRRFGTPKTNALLWNRKLVDYAIKIAKLMSDNVLVVTGEKKICFDDESITVKDIFPGMGPLGGIYTALLKSPTPYVATLPCDMPFLTPEIFKFLFSCLDGTRPVVAVSQSGVEPMIAIWHKSALDTIFKNIERKKLSIYATLEHLDVVKVVIKDKVLNDQNDVFTNINYKQDLENILQLYYQKTE